MLPYADVAQVLDQAAEAADVSHRLVRAVAWVESRWNPDATGPVTRKTGARAVGLMQLMPRTAEGLGVEDPTDAEQNASGGARYLASMLRKFKGSEHRALAAYNWGPGNVEKQPNPALWPASVRLYVARVQERKIRGVSPELYARERGAGDGEQYAEAEPTDQTHAATARDASPRADGPVDRGKLLPLSSSRSPCTRPPEGEGNHAA